MSQKALTPREKGTLDIVKESRKLSKKALKVLEEVMGDPTVPATARIAAAKEILNRGHGSSPRQVNVAHGLSDEQLGKLAGAIADQRKRLKAEEPKVIEAEIVVKDE